MSGTGNGPIRDDALASIPWATPTDVPAAWRAHHLTYKYEMHHESTDT